MHVTVKKSDQHLCNSVSGIAEIMTRQNWFAKDSGGKLYIYRNGVYVDGAKAEIAKMYKQIIKLFSKAEKWTSQRGNEIVAYIAADAPMLLESPGMDYINVRNGLIDVWTGILMAHTPDHRTTVQLPVEYDPEATCEGWEKFFKEVLPSDSQELIWELIAWLMVPNGSYQKAVVFLGSGANGKSTALRAIRAFLGESNISTVSLQDLNENRFAPAQLIGKLANIFSDLPNTKLKNTSILKAITGGDPIQGERKYEGAFSFTPTARLIFAANEMPRTDDASEGYYRRMLVIPFWKRFPNIPEVARALDADLRGHRELSGVLNRALAVLPRVLKSGLTLSPSMQLADEEHQRSTDAVAEWLDINTVRVKDGFTSKSDMYKEYRVTGQEEMSQKAFGQRVQRYLDKSMHVQRTVDGQRVWGYLGLRLRREQDALDALDHSSLLYPDENE